MFHFFEGNWVGQYLPHYFDTSFPFSSLEALPSRTAALAVHILSRHVF